MKIYHTAILCCLVMCWKMAVLAERPGKEGGAEEEEKIFDDQESRDANETSSLEVGPPDSHELMNNRELAPKVREKRSYEFLMGLINNNSRYEVTRVDPSLVTEKPKVVQENKITASELLLELMVRIASHPQQWENVHKLLQKLDRDLTTSRSIISKLQANSSLQHLKDNEEAYVDIKKPIHKNKDSSTSNEDRQPEEAFDRRKNATTKHYHTVYKGDLKWPKFDDQKTEASVKFVNKNDSNSSDDTSGVLSHKNHIQRQNKTSKITYPKNFSYHRVTGKPIYLNKKPKAYVAVSVISPKSPNDDATNDDVILEKELRRLKPVYSPKNNQMLYRSRWLVRTNDERAKPLTV